VVVLVLLILLPIGYCRSIFSNYADGAFVDCKLQRLTRFYNTRSLDRRMLKTYCCCHLVQVCRLLLALCCHLQRL